MDKMSEVFRIFLSKWMKSKWNGNQSSFAVYLGIRRQRLSNILNGHGGTSEDLRIRICNKLGIDYRTLISCDASDTVTLSDAVEMKLIRGGQAEKAAPPSQNLIVQVNTQADKEFLNGITELYRGIPLYESGRLAAGVNGIEFDPYESPASMVLVYKPELQGCSRHKLAAIKVGGESMEPTIVKGSIVVVDLSDKEQVDGKVYAVNTPEGGMDMASIKRIKKWEKGFVLLSDNSNYPPELSPMDWHRLCVGRVVWMWRDIRNI